jgi:peptidoglycan/xylan/chitin deacetylase (PgdA/CDA1 family)
MVLGARLSAMVVASADPGRVVVLAYHAIADHREDPVLRRYSVPRARFAAQLDALRAAGWTFVDADAVIAALLGDRALPPRAVLITFDDAYVDFETEALPELASRRIPAVVFALAGSLGGTNDWDREPGSLAVRLMDGEQLRRVAAAGVEIGSHAYCHRRMDELRAPDLAHETGGSAAALASLGLPRPRLFAYPYGSWSPAAAEAVREAGYQLAFTVTEGYADRTDGLYALPRVMVLRGYRPLMLRLKLLSVRRGSELLRRCFEVIGTRG